MTANANRYQILAYTHPMNLKIHKQEHSGAKPFQCEMCGRCFRTTNRLKTHKMSHTGDFRSIACFLKLATHLFNVMTGIIG